jgi:hypothetical protein
MDVIWYIVLPIAVISGIFYLLMPPVKFKCLKCGQSLKMRLHSAEACWRCGAYHMKEGKGARLMREGDVLSTCDVDAPCRCAREILVADPGSWRWPAECCICGGPVERRDEFTVGYSTGSSMGGMQIEVTRWKFKVPYCHAHSEGVRWGSFEPESVAYGNYGMAVKFKSYSYWKKFMQLNSEPNPKWKD